MRRLLVPLAALALVAVLVVGLLQAGSSGDGAATVPAAERASGAPSLAEQRAAVAGAPAPIAALHARAGRVERGDLEDQLRELRGHPVVLNKWASWCGPCKAEFPAFAQAVGAVGDEVAFLGVNAMDARGDAERFLAGNPLLAPHFEDVDGDVARRLGLGRNFPVTAFFDERGELVQVHQGGYRDAAELLADIRRYLRA